jgi:hypothetical protein
MSVASKNANVTKKDQILAENIWKHNNVQIGRMSLREVKRAVKINGDVLPNP